MPKKNKKKPYCAADLPLPLQRQLILPLFCKHSKTRSHAQILLSIFLVSIVIKLSPTIRDLKGTRRRRRAGLAPVLSPARRGPEARTQPTGASSTKSPPGSKTPVLKSPCHHRPEGPSPNLHPPQETASPEAPQTLRLQQGDAGGFGGHRGLSRLRTGPGVSFAGKGAPSPTAWTWGALRGPPAAPHGEQGIAQPARAGHKKKIKKISCRSGKARQPSPRPQWGGFSLK